MNSSRAGSRLLCSLAVLGLMVATTGRAQNTGAPTGVAAPSDQASRQSGLSQLPESDAASRHMPAVPARTEEGELGGSSFRIWSGVPTSPERSPRFETE